jgi:ribosome-associated heat shock protein Hsp15
MVKMKTRLPIEQSSEAAESATVRLDQWLLAARFAKTRAAAKATLEAGRVQLNGQTAKAARFVRIGDRISAPRGEERYELEVLELATRRGSPSAAQLLYSETPESTAARAQRREERRDQPQFTAPPARPDKRARRNLLDLLSGR